MQYEHDISIVSKQSLSSDKYDVLSTESEHVLQGSELTDERLVFAITDKIGILEGNEQESSYGKTGMTGQRQRPSSAMWRLILAVGDGAMLLVSLILMLKLAPHLHLGLHFSFKEPETWALKLVWACIALICWTIAVSITQAQDILHLPRPFRSASRALFALLLMLIFWIIITYPFIGDRIQSSVAILLIFLAIAAPFLCIWRLAQAWFMRFPCFRPQAVIVGANTAGQIIAKELCTAERDTVNILGYISENADESPATNGLPILGGRRTLRWLAQSGLIDIIIMSIDYKTNPTLFREAIEATQLNITVVPMSTAYERTSSKIPVEHIGDQWYIALPSEVALAPLYLSWRKVMDVAFALLGMLVFVLVLPIIALLIRVDSRGPIFYRQERLGYRGRKFMIYKFRSMFIDAEQAGRAIWSAERDTRITRVGRFMRATHLDELPQVLNIARGNMSLIGPRPEREEFVVALEQSIPFYRCRLMVKPGLTGWAQVKYRYGRSEHDALEKLQYDLYYIKHQSFMLDIFILLKTVFEVLAYRGV